MSESAGLDGWTTGRCRVGSVELSFLRSRGGRQSLVGLHGLIGSGRCLIPLARSLGSDLDLVLPDSRGHGGSDAPRHGYSYEDLAGDVLGLVFALELRNPVLLGHSMGGLAAAVAAARVASSIRSLVLVDPTFISPEWQREVYEGDVAGEHVRSLALSRSELLDQARLRHPARSAEMIEALVDARLRTRPSAFQVLKPPNPDYRQVAERIRVPTLLITGGRGVISSETADELARVNPAIRHEHIEDAGHGMPYDIPDRVGAAVLAFLREALS